MQTVKVDDPGLTIRKQFRDPNYIAANYKGGNRRDEQEARRQYYANRSCPVMTPYNLFRRS